MATFLLKTLLLIYKVQAWIPSNIEGAIYCDDVINVTISENNVHYWQLIIYYDLNITFSTCHSTFDTQIKVFDSYQNEISKKYCVGNDCPELKTICIDNTANPEFFTLPLNTGIYYVGINGFFVVQTICSSRTELQTRTPQPKITETQTNFMQTQTNTYKILELNTSNLICKDLLNSIDIIYNIDYDSCVYDYCLNMNACVMINYINNFKSASDSRCYLFQKQCEIAEPNSKQRKGNFKIAVKGYNTANQCSNYPNNWVDLIGDNCNDYTVFNWCHNGNINDNLTFHDFAEIKDNKYGLTAMDVCCDCGGGIHSFDDFDIKYMHSIENITNSELLCPWNVDESGRNLQKRKWNGLHLYQLCIELIHSNVCETLLVPHLAHTMNVSVIICDESMSDNSTNFLYFLMIIATKNKHKNTIYINSEWFLDIHSEMSDYFELDYEECLDEIFYENFDEFHAILPCDMDRNTTENVNISFANNTKMYTTKATNTNFLGEATTVPDINENNTIWLVSVLNSGMGMVFIIGFAIVIGLICVFIAWFCGHTNSRDKKTKIQFSKLKSEVQEIGRRNSMPSLGRVSQNVRILRHERDEEQKVAIIRVHDCDEEKDIHNNNQCLLCCDNTANVVLWPCAHVCFCNKCANNAVKNDPLCPQCRNQITAFKQIFCGGFRM